MYEKTIEMLFIRCNLSIKACECSFICYDRYALPKLSQNISSLHSHQHSVQNSVTGEKLHSILNLHGTLVLITISVVILKFSPTKVILGNYVSNDSFKLKTKLDVFKGHTEGSVAYISLYSL